MTDPANCPQCGRALPPDSPQGLCPACLLKRGLEANTVGFTADDQARAQPSWTPPTPEELAPLFPDLDILALIGRGGMGAVYKARQKELDRLVALKILPPEIGKDPSFAQRFAREAQAMARLSHANIVTIHDFGQRDGLFFFVMEYIDGLSLRQLLQAGTISPKEALAIVPQICDALQYAHDRGIVHRDIKPENILLNRQGQVKIADFGLAKLVGNLGAEPAGSRGAPGAAGASLAGERIIGTPQYMAPEQMHRPAEVDHRADIYSLGVVFYQMLTGELPTGRFEPPSRKVLIDCRLDEVVLRALEKEPARCYQQVSEVRTQVETIVGTQSPMDRTARHAAKAGTDAEGNLGVDRRREWRWWQWRNPISIVVVRNGRRAVQLPTLFMWLILIAAVEAVVAIAHVPWEYALAFAVVQCALIPITILWGWTVPLDKLAVLDSPAQDRRLSRLAVVGLCWAPFAFIAFVLRFTASSVESVSPGTYHGPQWWQIALMVLLGGLGLTAPFGTTICGAVAISQIRHSAGRLYGLGLAVFDALFFPLLLLDGLIAAGCYFALHAFDYFGPIQHVGGGLLQARMSISAVLVAFVSLAICLPLDVLIARWAWRKAKGPADETDNSEPEKPRALWVALVLGILLLIGLVLWQAALKRPRTQPAAVATPPTSPAAAMVWNAIDLAGVIPDGGDDLLDAQGKLIGQIVNVGSPGYSWQADTQARALVLDIPASPELQWATFPEVYVSGLSRRLSGSMGGWTGLMQGKKRRMLGLVIDKSYQDSGLFRNAKVPISRIDVKLKYYLSQRGQALFTFAGPFQVGQAVPYGRGSQCTVKTLGPMDASGRGTKFHLSATVNIGDDPPLAYDVEGKRYFAQSARGSTSGSGNSVRVEMDYALRELPLTRLAAITVGEKPQEKTFRNILIRYPDRPARAYPEYLDKLAGALGLKGLSAEQLQQYQFKDAQEALKVIDIVRGSHLEWAWQAISSVDLAKLDEATREKLHDVGKTWLDNGVDRGIELGLRGQWPEFVAPALELLSQGQEGRHVSEIARALQSYGRFTPEQLDQIAGILQQRDDPRMLYSLLWCLNMNKQRGGQDRLLRLARSEKVWLWWPALGYISGSEGLSLAQLTRDLQIKYLARTNPELGLDAALAEEARALLAKSLSAKLAAMSISTLSEAMQSIDKNLPRERAQAAMLGLLADLVNHWEDYWFDSYSTSFTWPVDRAVRYLNNWNKLNMGGIGASTTQETDSLSPAKARVLAQEVLEHFGNASATASATLAGVQAAPAAPAQGQSQKATLTDALGQPIAGARLDLQAMGFNSRPIQDGPELHVQTDDQGRFSFTWAARGKKQIFGYIGRASHPDYGIAQVQVSGGDAPTSLVRKSTAQYERALKGQVVNEAGAAVGSALVESTAASAPGKYFQGSARVIADAEGNFVLHLAGYSAEEKDRLLPPGAMYDLVARAPAGMDLFPVFAKSQTPARLVLRTPELGPRKLEFEVGDNQFARDEERYLAMLSWTLPPDKSGKGGSSVSLEHRYLNDEPVRLMPGRYAARYSDGHGRDFSYLPADIDENSPETVVFRRPPAVTYHGQVADGLSGEPAAGAFVFTYGSVYGGSNLAMLFEQDWRLLAATPAQPSLDDPGVKALGRHYVIESIVRTDENGRFQLTRGQEQKAASLMAFAKDRLPMPVSLSKLKADERQRVEVPAISMFPAAYIKFIPKVPVGAQIQVIPQWEFQTQGQPEWFGRLRTAVEQAGYPPWIDVSGPVRVFAPAGVKFKLQLMTSPRSWAAQPDGQVLELSAGETKDIGEVEFVPAGRSTTTSRPASSSRPSSGS